MSSDNRKKHFYISVILTVIFIIGSIFIVSQEVSNIETTLIERANERANKIKEKMVLIQSFLHTMGNNIEEYMAMAENLTEFHPLLDEMEDYPRLDLTAIDTDDETHATGIVGGLRARGSHSDLSIRDKQEISATLYMRSNFLSALEYIPDLKWIYYFSKNHFIYTVPHLPLDAFRRVEEDYNNKEYWIRALPENNPERRLVMTRLYEDTAGKGYLVTFSKPVYIDDEFRGIIGMDISLGDFNEIMLMKTIIGDSFLIDESNYILASNLPLLQGQILDIPEGISGVQLTHHSADNKDYISFEIISNEARLIHQLDRNLKYKAALYNSLRELLLLLSVVVMSYMIYYSRILIYKVSRYANMDPLTSLLNRRAMQNAVMPLLSINKRYQHKMCFLLADIDHFKLVNDTYGHLIGDKVLKSVTKVLNDCLRSSDLVSRHGGEEFLIVLPQTDLENGFLLAERIRSSVENTRIGEQQIGVTISIGCVEVLQDESYDSAISRADKLLYKAKQNGRNKTLS